MKKLSLKRLDLNSSDLLVKEKLKTVFGGYDYGGGNPGGGNCWPNGHPCIVNGSIPCCEYGTGYSYCRADPGYSVFGHCVAIV